VTPEQQIVDDARVSAINSMRLAAEASQYVAEVMELLRNEGPREEGEGNTLAKGVPVDKDVLIPEKIKVLPHPATFNFDWDALRFLVNHRAMKDDQKLGQIGRKIGIPGDTLTAFARGTRTWLTPDVLFRVLLWLGFNDFTEFMKEEDK
jgi:hypothetical protein